MAADMQGGIAPEFFARYSIAQLRSLSPRELEACGRLVDPIYAGPGETHYRVVSWDEAIGRACEQAEGDRTRPQFLLRKRPLVERSWIRAAAARAGVRNQQRQQLFVLLPPGERCRSGSEPRIGHRNRAARRHRRQRSVRADRRQSRVQPSAAAAQPDGDAPPRRSRHRHQSGERDRARQLPCAERCAEPPVRQPTLRACTCSRTSAAISR